MTTLRRHNLLHTWPDRRQGLCAKCGEVNIKSAGSDGHGGTRWRCANQVNEYRRDRNAQKRAEKSGGYAFMLTWPCCGAQDPIEPDSITENGDAAEQFHASCPACGLVRMIDVEWMPDLDEGVVAVVTFADVKQIYLNGHLSTTENPAVSAQIDYARAEEPGPRSVSPATLRSSSTKEDRECQADAEAGSCLRDEGTTARLCNRPLGLR